MPLDPAEIVRRGRLAPGELLLVDPAAGRVLTDADAKSWVLRRLPLHDAPREVFADADGPTGVPAPAGGRRLPRLRRRGRRRDDPRPALPVRAGRREAAPRRADDGARRARAAVEHGRRHAARRAGPRRRVPPATTSARRSRRSPTRRSTPSASGPSWTSRWSSAAGRRSWAACPRAPRPCGSDARSSSTSTGCSTRSATAPGRRTGPCAGSTRRGRPPPAPPASRSRSTGSPPARSTPPARGPRSSSCPMRPPRSRTRQLPVPSVLAAGAVHTALAEAGLRGRTDIVVDAGDVLDVHGLAMVVAAGRRVVHPRLLLALAARAGRARAAPRSCPPHDAVGNMLAALDAGLRKVLARMGISHRRELCRRPAVRDARARARHRGPLLPRRGRVARAPRGGRPRRRPAPRLEEARALAAAVRPDRLPDPGFARFRGDGELHLLQPGERDGAPRRSPRPTTRRPASTRRLATLPRRPAARRGARPRRLPACGARAARRRAARRGRGRALASRAGSSCRR